MNENILIIKIEIIEYFNHFRKIFFENLNWFNEIDITKANK